MIPTNTRHVSTYGLYGAYCRVMVCVAIENLQEQERQLSARQVDELGQKLVDTELALATHMEDQAIAAAAEMDKTRLAAEALTGTVSELEARLKAQLAAHAADLTELKTDTIECKHELKTTTTRLDSQITENQIKSDAAASMTHQQLIGLNTELEDRCKRLQDDARQSAKEATSRHEDTVQRTELDREDLAARIGKLSAAQVRARPFKTVCLPLNYSGNSGVEWRILQGTLAPPVRTHTACAWRISQGGLRGVQDEGQAVTAGKLAAQEKSAAQSVEKLQVLTPSIPAVYP